ncbi:GDSL family lipase [Methylobacterium sp. XJLW]|uniref:G-D-S-L family Lipolytic protein n=1 Tax=Methylobacterium oryzae CBMB20 TaxID=693986 RepID=A0A089NPZ9_9HYPH|nr:MULTISPECIES: SGNH/GDSL hydrolase family protein [Methylobacterium]AIQ89467.1 G-D-S-L family Lipolytic protein [Methylobacterium oryzae CBMB20]AWV18206.1 GDSL family lipase [Methylobacterium sp. XJLW]
MDVPWIETAARHWRHGRIVGRRFADRRPGIRAALRAAAPDSVLLAGNSHAEFVGTPDLGGRACINIAVGGSTAVDCGRHLAELRVPTRCAAAVLIIGTNDLQRWRHPERARVVDRFEADVRRILRSLEAWSAQVFVAAVPPVGIGATGRDPAAVAVFSDRLARLCAEGGHTFFDPFAAWRAGTGGLAGPGLHRDGVHLADYAPLAAALSRAVAGMVPPAGRPLRPDVPCPGPRPTPVATAPAATAPLRVLRAAWVGRP